MRWTGLVIAGVLVASACSPGDGPESIPLPPRPTRRPRRQRRPHRRHDRAGDLPGPVEVRSDHPAHHRRGVAHPRRRRAERHLRAGMGERREPRLHAARSGDQGLRHAGRCVRPRTRRRQHQQRLRVARDRHRHDRGSRFRRRPGDHHRRVPSLHRRLERLPGRRRDGRPVRLVRRRSLGAPARAGGGVHLRPLDRPVRE